MRFKIEKASDLYPWKDVKEDIRTITTLEDLIDVWNDYDRFQLIISFYKDHNGLCSIEVYDDYIE